MTAPEQIQTIHISVSKKQQEKPLAVQILQIGNQISNLLYGKALEQCLGKKQKIPSVNVTYNKNNHFCIKMPCSLDDVKDDKKSIVNYNYITNMVKHGSLSGFSMVILWASTAKNWKQQTLIIIFKNPAQNANTAYN